MKLYFCSDAYHKAVAEAQKFYDLGIRNSKSPWEAVMYPLSAIFLKSHVHKSPFDFIEFDDIDHVVITHTLIPPARFKNYSSHSATFLPGGSEEFQKTIDVFRDRYPLTEMFIKMHSHTIYQPFLSLGDLRNHIFNSFGWFRMKGLNTMLSLLLYRTANNADISTNYWSLACYALAGDYIMVRVPFEIVSRNHSRVRAAKLKPFYMTPEGNDWFRKNDSLLRERYVISANTIRRGWKRFYVKADEAGYIIAIPPEFPKKLIKAYRIRKDVLHTYHSSRYEHVTFPMNSPWWDVGRDFQHYDLSEMVDWLLTI